MSIPWTRLPYLGRVWAGSQFWPSLLPAQVKPLSASLKLTENCQAKCITCNYWQSRWEDGLNTEKAVEVINRLGDFGIRYLRFTGGEPLLRRDLFQIMQKAKMGKFKRVTLQTNGLLLKKLSNEINDSPITKVAVSIDGLEASNDLIRGIRGYFKLAMEGIRLLRGKQVQVVATLNGRSAGELEELAEEAKRAGAGFAFNILDDRSYFLRQTSTSDLWPNKSEIQNIMSFLRNRLKRPAYELDYIFKYFSRETPEEPPCVLGFIEVFVVSNGDVLAGCYVLKPIGNLLREDFKELISSRRYRDACLAMVRRECPGCTCGIHVSLAFRNVASPFARHDVRPAGIEPVHSRE
ncbi:MAG TPA: radical SAM protein [Candidatus Sulfotelmatobacter sp.]|nr:radical SAM protein [Candidatus Sulfotelmatobacter sp.]